MKAIAEQGGEQPKTPIFDEFARDLVILYAVDSELSVFYMNQEHMEELNMPREELRTLALANLRRLLPEIERVGAGGLFLFRAGSTYESSLLLLDTIWAGVQAEVQGAPVVAIPTRDCLLVCGADNKEHLAKLKAMAQMAWKAGPYSLTPTPFIYRNDRFLPYEE
ncbi:MAG: DUF1444 family protein [FCB group bacterium]|jgi:uncharacterized protein YtpQ (UPF0354 family)|nr:DUF1444 family protein [FCB group bacterium]